MEIDEEKETTYGRKKKVEQKLKFKKKEKSNIKKSKSQIKDKKEKIVKSNVQINSN